MSVPRVASRLGEPEVVERVLARLQEMRRRTGLGATLAIGELILVEFFGGDAAAWQDRRKNKNNSIRRLAGRSDCPFSRSALDLAVTVYVASLAMPCAQTFGHIGASHVAAVLGLPETERVAMLELAERERLSVRELRLRIVDARRRRGELRGRPAISPTQRSLHMLEEAVLGVRQCLAKFSGQGAVDSEVCGRLLNVARDIADLHQDALSLAGPKVAGAGRRLRDDSTQMRSA